MAKSKEKEADEKVENIENKAEEVPQIVEETKAEKKDSKAFAYFIIFILIIALGYTIFHIRSLNDQLAEKPKEKIINNIVPDKEWYKEDCKCIVWGGEKYCSEGFAFNKTAGSWCYSPEGKKSPALVPCSKFDCAELTVTLKKGAAKSGNETSLSEGNSSA